MMQPIPIDELQEGDLVFFNTGGRGISHVGVYVQNNKFTRFNFTRRNHIRFKRQILES